MPLGEPSAADAEAISVELFAHNWCDQAEALQWSVLFAERARDERREIQARRANGERDVSWDEVTRLQDWAWVARQCAAHKSESALIYRSRRR